MTRMNHTDLDLPQVENDISTIFPEVQSHASLIFDDVFVPRRLGRQAVSLGML